MIIISAKYVKHARMQFVKLGFGNKYTNIIYKIGICIREVNTFAQKIFLNFMGLLLFHKI